MNKLVSIISRNTEIALLDMHDQKGKNIFSEPFMDDLISCLKKLADDKSIKVIILKGLDDIFCAGAAKSQLMELFKGDISVKDLVLSEMLIQLPVPVIAAMEGGAVGGGLVIGLCADIVIMAERSMYGATFTNMGFTPGMGCTGLLQALVGDYIANELMFTGKLYKGKTFKGRGVVNYILPKDQILAKAYNLAEIIAEKPRKTLEILKYSLSLKKRKALTDARLQEDLMHQISFNQAEVKQRIETIYKEP